MFEIMEGLPDDMLGVRASGQITDADYRNVLVPKVEALLTKYPKIRMVFVMEDSFSGYDLAAIKDDAFLGLKHWNGFTAVAVVTNVAWMHTMLGLFAPMMPCRVKLFKLAELDAAKSWILKA